MKKKTQTRRNRPEARARNKEPSSVFQLFIPRAKESKLLSKVKVHRGQTLTHHYMYCRRCLHHRIPHHRIPHHHQCITLQRGKGIVGAERRYTVDINAV